VKRPAKRSARVTHPGLRGDPERFAERVVGAFRASGSSSQGGAALREQQRRGEKT